MLTIARALFRWWWSSVTSVADTLMVWCGVKYWPATGPAQWIGRLPKPDPQAGSWQAALRAPCTHVDVHGVSWAIPMDVMHRGVVRRGLCCTQCHAYRVWLPSASGGALSADWHQGVS
jgi:hypothetical protein